MIRTDQLPSTQPIAQVETPGATELDALVAILKDKLRSRVSSHAAKQLAPVLAEMLPDVLAADDVRAVLARFASAQPSRDQLVLDLIAKLRADRSDAEMLGALSSAIESALGAKVSSAANGEPSGAALALPLGEAGTLFVERSTPLSDADVALARKMALHTSHALEEARELRRLHELAYTDDLTQLPNRRAFRERASEAIKTCHDQGDPCSILFMDLDAFRRLNKVLGHGAGNRALETVGKCIAEHGGKERSGRYGGEEFLVVLPGISPLAAEEIAQSIRTSIAAETKEGIGRKVTASIGVIGVAPGQSLNDAIDSADRLQSIAKRGGKNRVITVLGRGHKALAKALGLPAEALIFSGRLKQAVEKQRDPNAGLLGDPDFAWVLNALDLFPEKKGAAVTFKVPRTGSEVERAFIALEKARESYAKDPRGFGLRALALAGKLDDELHRIQELPRKDRRAAIDHLIELAERVHGKSGHALYLSETVIPAAFQDPKVREVIRRRTVLDEQGLAALEAKLVRSAKLMTLGEIESSLGAPKKLDQKERTLLVQDNLKRSAELIERLGLDDENDPISDVVRHCRYSDTRSFASMLLDVLDQLSAVKEPRPWRKAFLTAEQVEGELQLNIDKKITDPELGAAIIEWNARAL